MRHRLGEAEPHLRGRLGEHGIAERFGQRPHRARQIVPCVARPADDDASRAPGQLARRRVERRLVRIELSRCDADRREDVGRPPRKKIIFFWVVLAGPRRGERDERFPERRVEMHGTAWRAQGPGSRSGGHRAQVPQRLRRALRNTEIGEEPHVRSEQVLLVQSLRRAEAVQLGGPVRGERDDRDAARLGLQQRRIEVRACGAGRRHHQRRLSRRLCCPEREERAAALVDHRPDGEPRLGGAREGEGSRTRPRRDHRFRSAGGAQLVDERARPPPVEAGAHLGASSASSSARALSCVSIHSDWGEEPSTIPAPRKRRAAPSESSAQRSATASSARAGPTRPMSPA